MSRVTGSITGRIDWTGAGKRPVSGATVCAVHNKVTLTSTTNEDGEFIFSDVSTKGQWTLIPMHHSAKAANPKVVEFEENNEEVQVLKTELNLIRHGGTPNKRAGIGILLLCMITTMLLTYYYWVSHNKAMTSYEQSNLVSLIVNADGLRLGLLEKQPNKMDLFEKKLQLSLDKFNKYPYEDLLSKKVALKTSLRAVQKRLIQINSFKGEVLTQEIVSGAEIDIANLKQALEEMQPSYFWTSKPWIFIELWCWGLLGLLMQKIMRIGWYIRSNRYFSEGTWMHIAHLIVIPVFGVIATLMLSMIQFKSSSIVVDFSHPEAVVVIAFMLCLFPWKLYDFIRGKGEGIMV